MMAAASTMHHTCALHRRAHPRAGQRSSSFSAEFRHAQGPAFPNISQAFPAVSTSQSYRNRPRLLICIGVGTDRANGVSDAATLRAAAELTAASAFCGCASLHPATGGLYRKCIKVSALGGWLCVLVDTSCCCRTQNSTKAIAIPFLI